MRRSPDISDIMTAIKDGLERGGIPAGIKIWNEDQPSFYGRGATTHRSKHEVEIEIVVKAKQKK